VELNTYIRKRRESLARFERDSFSDYSDDDRQQKKNDDQELLRNMQFILNRDQKQSMVQRTTTLVDIELDADAQEDDIEFDNNRGSLGSDRSSPEIANPYVEQPANQRTHTFVDYTSFSYFPENAPQIQSKPIKKEKVRKDTFELQNGEKLFESSESSDEEESQVAVSQPDKEITS
jgi:hypothetical protein